MFQKIEYLSNLVGSLETKILLVFIFLVILLLIPIFISLLLPFFFKQLNNKTKTYLYAFVTGFFIVMSLFGFMREALEISSVNSQRDWGENYVYISNILIVAGGSLIGIFISFFIKYIISYKVNKKLLASKQMSAFVHVHDHDKSNVHSHTHPDIIFNKHDSVELTKDINKKSESKLKFVALLLLLTHRIPEGIILGNSISLIVEGSSNDITIAFIISLILHLIPEEIIFFYRLREAGYSKWKAVLISISGLLLFLPFMLIGSIIGKYILQNWVIYAAMQSLIGGIFLFTSLVEFFPEFYHSNFDKKSWVKTLIFLFAGIIISIFILSFHLHGSSPV